MALNFPFTAIVAQDEMKLAIALSTIEPSIGGVLIFGDRGTGKSTTIRSLAALLPPMKVVTGCPYHCDPGAPTLCFACEALKAAGDKLKTNLVSVPVVDMPLGATEDRVVGALDIEKALSQGVKVFEPGLLAKANRGYLYIDEVNLLEDHLVDLLIDVSASGENVVEREGLSIRHPARFVLIGSGNPEEGELRPQMLDRFGLSVEVRTPQDLAQRIDIIKRRDAFERDPVAFLAQYEDSENEFKEKILSSRKRLSKVTIGDDVLMLFQHFADAASERHGLPPHVLQPAQRATLLRHAWPGNVRELQNVIERAVILCTREEIGPEHLALGGEPVAAGAAAGVAVGAPVSIDVLERAHIEAVMANADTLEAAARTLGIDGSTLYRKRKAYGL